MTIRARVFVAMLLLTVAGLYLLINWVGEDLKPRYREATEEPLVDAAHLLASFASSTSKEGLLDVKLFKKVFSDVYSKTFSAQIYGLEKKDVDYRVYITNHEGILLFDSLGEVEEGTDYSTWRDISLTLQGKYGARTTKDDPNDLSSSVLYVAAPIIIDESIAGVLTVGKPTFNSNSFLEDAQSKFFLGSILASLIAILFGIAVSSMVTKPLRRLTDYARQVRDGARVDLPKLGGKEIKELGLAFEEMREALEGKQYVENYVQTLTHEVKSPLSAISGAEELLREEMSSERRDKFLDNIKSETRRIRTIVERLLLLSSVENRRALTDVIDIHLRAVVEEILDGLAPLLEQKSLNINLDGDKTISFKGEYFLVRQAINNIIQNAIEFSPESSSINISIKQIEKEVELKVRDAGPGIPSYAVGKVFDRFYSLKRPDTGKKSSGLGLSLVREVLELHKGSYSIRNGVRVGTETTISFPTNI